MKQNAWLQRLFRAIGWIVVGLWVGIAGNGQIYAQGDGLDGVESNKTEVVDMVTGVDCHEFEITELMTNYREVQDEQFVEFYNPTAQELSLNGCEVRTKYSGKTLVAVFGEVRIEAEAYQAFSLVSLGLRLAKSPTAERVIEVAGGDYIALSDLPKGTAGKSFALVGDEWVRATPTPSADNLTAPEFMEVGAEDEEKVSTGAKEDETEMGAFTVSPEALVPIEYESSDVRNEGATTEYADCGEGRYRNPETNRCKKIEAEVDEELVPCPEGQERNPETNRCRKIASEEPDELKPCEEGYERNPETNRCRKVREQTMLNYTIPDSGENNSEPGGGSPVWQIVLTGAAVAFAVGGVAVYHYRERLRHVPLFARIEARIMSIMRKK